MRWSSISGHARVGVNDVTLKNNGSEQRRLLSKDALAKQVRKEGEHAGTPTTQPVQHR
jgi:hypothetical protein